MPKNFYQKLKKPFFCLAPMSEITDAAFRRIVVKYGKPDVMWTEFVSCDGLCSSGRKNLLINLKHTQKERPIMAQFFGTNPNNFLKCAQLAQKLGFDGIDINMGCPHKHVEKQGAGAALIKNPKLAKEIIAATKRGAPGLPVSVKTRLGYNKNEITEWTKHLLEAKPDVIIMHGRTRKQGFSGEADWESIAKAVQIAKGSGTLIIGNGDVQSIADGKQKEKQYGVDGIMIGRAVLGNPWIFSGQEVSVKGRLKVLMEHAEFFEKIYISPRLIRLGRKNKKPFFHMYKHFSAYLKGYANTKKLKMKLMKTKNTKEVEDIINRY